MAELIEKCNGNVAMAKQGFGFSTIQSVAIAYIVIWSLFPPLEIDMIYRILALGSVLYGVYAGYFERTQLS